MDVEAIAGVRAFNRTVTERIGALEETYLGGGRPLGETRLLWEVGPGEPVVAFCVGLGRCACGLRRIEK